MLQEEQGGAAGFFSDGWGRGLSWLALAGADRGVPPEGGNGPPAASDGQDVAHLLYAAVVQSVGSGHGRRAVRQRVDARLCRTGSEPGRGARRVDDSALPASAGEAQVDRGDVCPGAAVAGAAGTASEVR